ncbi:MAG: DUF86 domain-containing protein [Anaerolineales bacterium]|nr:DUF86 domain-containing protein [Anaerolineales bacterium]
MYGFSSCHCNVLSAFACLWAVAVASLCHLPTNPAQNGWRRPESIADAFAVLAENDVIQLDFLPTLQRMARFRNRLVHLYWEVDVPIIYRILQENLADFDRFERDVLDYMSK